MGENRGTPADAEYGTVRSPRPAPAAYVALDLDHRCAASTVPLCAARRVIGQRKHQPVADRFVGGDREHRRPGFSRRATRADSWSPRLQGWSLPAGRCGRQHLVVPCDGQKLGYELGRDLYAAATYSGISPSRTRLRRIRSAWTATGSISGRHLERVVISRRLLRHVGGNLAKAFASSRTGRWFGYEDRLHDVSHRLLSRHVELGLQWVAAMVFARPAMMVPYTRGLPEWLISGRAVAEDPDSGDVWQRIVDDFVVAGCCELADYTD